MSYVSPLPISSYFFDGYSSPKNVDVQGEKEVQEKADVGV